MVRCENFGCYAAILDHYLVGLIVFRIGADDCLPGCDDSKCKV